jgi:raffinose/stachyose/melibiose transport system permease protein
MGDQGMSRDAKVAADRAFGTSAISKCLAIIGKALAYAVMGFFALMAIYPIIWLIVNSFKSNADYQLNKVNLPPIWYPKENYGGAWSMGDFSKLLPNSLIYTVVGTLGVVLIATLASFAFAKLSSRAKNAMYGSFVIGILLSLSSLMVPLFLQLSQLDALLSRLFVWLRFIKDANSFNFFYNSRYGVILVYIGSGLPMAIYLTTEYIKGIPTSLIEAARLDGAGYFRIYWSIILQMCMPILITVAIITLPGIWNEFALINIIVGRLEFQSLPLGIMRFNGDRSVDYGKQFAALVMGLAPMLLFYIAFRKQIAKGVSGVKG